MGNATDFVDQVRREGVRRQHHAGVAGVNTRVLNMLKHTANDGGLAIRDRIDVEFDCVFKELVEQHRLARRDIEGLAHDGLQLVHAVDDEHAATTENERRTEEDREADLFGG